MASTKGAIIHPCLPATPQSAVHCRIPHLLLLCRSRMGKNKRHSYGPTSNQSSAAAMGNQGLSASLSPSTHDVYLSLCRARRASNGLLSRPLSLAHGGPPIRVGNDLQSSAAKWRFGSERASERVGFITRSLMGTAHTYTHVGPRRRRKW